MNTLGKAILDWWPLGRWVVVIVIAATLGMGKLFWDVEQLKTADDKALIQRIEAIEARTNDAALIDWNRWRAGLELRVDRLETR